MIIFGLDLGSKCGACKHDLATGDVALFWFDWSDLPWPDRVILFGEFLERELTGPDFVVGYEEIKTARGKGLVIIARQEGVLWYMCRSVPFVGVINTELKKHATGSGKAEKPEMIEAARGVLLRWGTDPGRLDEIPPKGIDDVADAIHVADWVEQTQLKRWDEKGA